MLFGPWRGNLADGGEHFTDGWAIFPRSGLLPDAIGVVSSPWQDDDEDYPRPRASAEVAAERWRHFLSQVQIPVVFGRTFAHGRPWLEVVRPDHAEAWVNPEILLFVRGATGCDRYAQATGPLDAIVCYRKGEPVAAFMPMKRGDRDSDPAREGTLLPGARESGVAASTRIASTGEDLPHQPGPPPAQPEGT